MKLNPPIKNFKPYLYPTGDVTQFFGANHDLYSKAVCYGSDCLQGHNGWDIVRKHGEPILAVESGKVVDVRNDATGFGKHVRILTIENEWTYGHLSEISVSLGQEVKAGQQIGKMGNTGFVVAGSTPYWKFNPYAGTHLHLGLRKVRVPKAGEFWNVSYPSKDIRYIENYSNGFFGSVEFKPEDFLNYPQEVVDAMLAIKPLLSENDLVKLREAFPFL